MVLDNDALRAYQVLSGFLARQLYLSPSEENLSRLVEQRGLLLEEPFSTVSPHAARTLSEELATADAQGEEGRNAFLASLQHDFTYLFKMVGMSGVSPYESVYRTDDRTVFGPTTLEVRACYKAFGLETEKLGQEPEDHIGLEFSFIEYLLECLIQQRELGEDEASQATAEALCSFIGGHLMEFGFPFFRLMFAQAQSNYFKAVAELGVAVLESFREELLPKT